MDLSRPTPPDNIVDIFIRDFLDTIRTHPGTATVHFIGAEFARSLFRRHPHFDRDYHICEGGKVDRQHSENDLALDLFWIRHMGDAFTFDSAPAEPLNKPGVPGYD